jgi:hypothetical protein
MRGVSKMVVFCCRSIATRIDRQAESVVGGLEGDRSCEGDADRAEAVREIAAILAAAYLRLRFLCPSPLRMPSIGWIARAGAIRRRV